MQVKVPMNPAPSVSAVDANSHTEAQAAAIAEQQRHQMEESPKFGGGGRHQLSLDKSFIWKR